MAKKKAMKPIKIKAKNKGKFTKFAKKKGNSVQAQAQETLNDPNASPEKKKQANFARNAAKWKKGGKKK